MTETKRVTASSRQTPAEHLLAVVRSPTRPQQPRHPPLHPLPVRPTPRVPDPPPIRHIRDGADHDPDGSARASPREAPRSTLRVPARTGARLSSSCLLVRQLARRGAGVGIPVRGRDTVPLRGGACGREGSTRYARWDIGRPRAGGEGRSSRLGGLAVEKEREGEDGMGGGVGGVEATASRGTVNRVIQKFR